MIDADTGVTLDPRKVAEARASESIHENYRSRLVVREVKSKGDAALLSEFALFSSMPPLEALKLMCSLLATLRDHAMEAS